MPRGWPDLALLGITLFALPSGLALRGFGHGELATPLWNGSALLAGALLLVEILARLRRREIGVDLIALLAIGVAVFFEQALVAALVALMLASGRALENCSGRRAERELCRLIDRAWPGAIAALNWSRCRWYRSRRVIVCCCAWAKWCR